MTVSPHGDGRTFLEETEGKLAEYGFALKDIRKVIARPELYEDDLVEISPERFIELCDIPCGNHGWQEIMSIWVFGDGFLMYREEYDGAEWWELVPTCLAVRKDIGTLNIERYQNMAGEEEE